MFRARGENATKGVGGWTLVGGVEERTAVFVKGLLKIVRHDTHFAPNS
jgi:hypothetical protein